jgi:hypothetical protein
LFPTSPEKERFSGKERKEKEKKKEKTKTQPILVLRIDGFVPVVASRLLPPAPVQRSQSEPAASTVDLALHRHGFLS